MKRINRLIGNFECEVCKGKGMNIGVWFPLFKGKPFICEKCICEKLLGKRVNYAKNNDTHAPNS